MEVNQEAITKELLQKKTLFFAPKDIEEAIFIVEALQDLGATTWGGVGMQELKEYTEQGIAANYGSFYPAQQASMYDLVLCHSGQFQTPYVSRADQALRDAFKGVTDRLEKLEAEILPTSIKKPPRLGRPS